jgi:hypothetical protein
MTQGNQGLTVITYHEIRVVLTPTAYECWIEITERGAGAPERSWRYATMPRTMTLAGVWEQTGQGRTWPVVPASGAYPAP